jgi:hypothetical protein
MSKLIGRKILPFVLSSAMLLALAIPPATAGVAGPAAQLAAAPANASALDTIERRLAARGILADRVAKGRGPIAAPPGVEVDETVETAKNDDKIISRTSGWSEPLGADKLRVEVTTYPSRQYQVSFWVLSHGSKGCAMFGRTMYDQNNLPLKSEFWRNDRELKITGAADFPPDLYPSAVPAAAVARVLHSLHDGAQGTLNQQITPYGYVHMRVRVQQSEQLAVPAGTFSAFKVAARADLGKLLPNWPSFLLGVIEPFMPVTTYYFQSEPPYRLLKEVRDGAFFADGPEATTELVRYYIVGATADASGPGEVPTVAAGAITAAAALR